MINRKFILTFVLLLTALLLGSCDVHEFPHEPEPEPSKTEIEIFVSFANTDWIDFETVEWNLPSRASRAEVHVLRYNLNIFKDENRSRTSTRTPIYSKVLYVDEPIDIKDVTQSISVELDPGKYSAIVWVDYVDSYNPVNDLYYDTTDFTYITLSGNDHQGNNHHREGFRGCSDFTVTELGAVIDTSSRADLERVPVVCERPMARYEFVTTDLAEFVTRYGINPASEDPEQTPGGPGAPPSPNLDDYLVRLRYTSYMPHIYNANTDKPIDAKLGVSFSGKINRINDNEASLGFDHVFVNHSQTTVNVALEVYDSKTGDMIASSDPVTVPLTRNKHTLVRGNFLTAQSGGSMGIDPGFEGDINLEIK